MKDGYLTFALDQNNNIKECEEPTAFQKVPMSELKKQKIIYDDDDEE